MPLLHGRSFLCWLRPASFGTHHCPGLISLADHDTLQLDASPRTTLQCSKSFHCSLFLRDFLIFCLKLYFVWTFPPNSWPLSLLNRSPLSLVGSPSWPPSCHDWHLTWPSSFLGWLPYWPAFLLGWCLTGKLENLCSHHFCMAFRNSVLCSIFVGWQYNYLPWSLCHVSWRDSNPSHFWHQLSSI
jgi:hypothetical protein